MPSFDELPWPEKRQRFRALAYDALSRYTLNVRRLELVSDETNLIYRVTTADGAHYALRLADARWRTKGDADSEAMWLDALARDTPIPVPRIVPARNGDPIVMPHSDAVPFAFHALLMGWIPGVLLGKRLSEPNLLKMGQLFGQLHLHGAAWQPPAGFTTRRFENFMARGEADRFLSEGYTAAYTPATLELLHLMRAHVEAAYAALDPADLRVIHCDLWHDNIKIHRGTLYPFDFEDTIWGYRLHDIAMAMLDLYEVLDMARYERLLAAFRRGYEEHLAWPAGDMTKLQIGRILWRINNSTRFDLDRRKKDAAFNAELFRRYLATGKLIPPLRAPPPA